MPEVLLYACVHVLVYPQAEMLYVTVLCCIHSGLYEVDVNKQPPLLFFDFDTNTLC